MSLSYMSVYGVRDEDEEGLFQQLEMPGTFLIMLPERYQVAQVGAAEEFARRIAALRNHLNGKSFTLVPFTYYGIVSGFQGRCDEGTTKLGVESYLVIVTEGE